MPDNDQEPTVVSLDTGRGIVSVDWPPPPRLLRVMRRMLKGDPPRPGEDPELDREVLLLMHWLEDQEQKHPTRWR